MMLKSSTFASSLLMVAAALQTVSAESQTNSAPAGKTPYPRDLSAIKRTVETLRGRQFQREVPAYTVSEQEMRSVVDADLKKNFPDHELGDYEALMRWLDLLPPGSELRDVYTQFFVSGVAGFYNTDTRDMCIPAKPSGPTNAWTNPANKEVSKQLRQSSTNEDNFVFAHEFTHALEDQYWPLDDSGEKSRRESTDRAAARSFLAEGSATRLMIEAAPALLQTPSGRDSGGYITIWNLIHSGFGESILDHVIRDLWKSSDAAVPGIPETLDRSEAMPYSMGYFICSKTVRDWGLDGLDYFSSHPPCSTEQIMHPEKAWIWRDLPVQILLPQTWPNGWTQRTGESLGEAGIAVLLGCSLTNLDRGEKLARGWDGDRVALFEGPDHGRLLVWASAWDSDSAARRFAQAWVKQRRMHHGIQLVETNSGEIRWTQPDGHAGVLHHNGRQVVCFESDRPESLNVTADWLRAVAFSPPPEDALRAKANSTFARANPFYSRQRDADYTVNRTLWGLLSRHDRNQIGAADRFVLGILGESRRTASFNKWELGWNLVAKHNSDVRQGISRTTVLPWGVLYSRFAAKVPQHPEQTFSRTRLVWGWAASQRKDNLGNTSSRVLPFGLLFRNDTSTNQAAVHVLGTGVTRIKPTAASGGTTRFRLLGIPLWTTHSRPLS